MPIDRDRLFEQSEGLENPLSCYWIEGRERAQVEIVRGEVGRRPRGGSAHLGGLQCRFDDSGNADGDFVLKLEHDFDRAVEAVGPEMSAGRHVDQLAGDAHPVATFAYRAFEHVAHAKFAADLLNIDGLPFVGEGRIAGDDEEPADTAERGDDLL